MPHLHAEQYAPLEVSTNRGQHQSDPKRTQRINQGPAEAGPFAASVVLLFASATRETETGEADANKRERRGLRHGPRDGRHCVEKRRIHVQKVVAANEHAVFN